MARCPPARGGTQGWWPSSENTLLIDDNPAKSVLNPPGNVIFPDPWIGDKNDTFLVDKLAPYLRRLVLHPGSIPDFVRSNPIGNAALSPCDNVYKNIMRLAKFNKLISNASVSVLVIIRFTYLMLAPFFDVFCCCYCCP